MDWGKWKTPIFGWAGLAFATWVLLYVLYWHDRTGHTVFWGDALINWIGDVVTLRWVKSYQTLLAGMMTFAAGAFVWFSYRSQRRDVLRDRAEERRASQLVTIVAIAHQLSVFHSNLITTADSIDRNLEALHASTLRLAEFAPGLSQWVNWCGDKIKEDWGHPKDVPGSYELQQKRARCMAISALMLGYFEDYERLFGKDGRLRHVPAKRSHAGRYNPDEYPIVEGMYEGA